MSSRRGLSAGIRHGLVGTLLILLAACAPVRTRVHEATPVAEAAQQAREAALTPRTHWTLTAHIGVVTDRDSGSGELDWRETGESYVFTVHAPITGKTWKLSGDARHAVLEGVESQPIEDDDVQRLLREHVGWDVPLASLRAWAFGMRASGSTAQVQYDDQNLPALIEQDGWKVEYRDWFADRHPALPRRVFASNASTRIKLAIYDWSLDE
jgi:outer membrane lipoprotein LolB